MFESRVFNMRDLIEFEQGAPIPGNPPWADLHFCPVTHVRDHRLHGPGVYEFFFKGRPLYLGSFCPVGGDVLKTRWIRHAGTLTLRDQRLSLNKRVVWQVCGLLPKFGPDAKQLVRDLEQADPDVLAKDRGFHSSKHRVLFAAEQWGIFRRLALQDLRFFQVVYVQVQPDIIAIKRGAIEIGRRVSAAEERLIKELRPRCNWQAEGYAPRLDYPIDDARKRIERVLRQELQVPAGSARLAAADAEEPASGVRKRPHPPEDADVADGKAHGNASERFFRSIDHSPAARTLVGRVMKLAAQLQAEVHHTSTHGGDFRIRCGHPAGRPLERNVLAMYWQKKSRVLKCEIGVPLRLCRDIAKRQANHRGKPLPTLLSVEPGVDDEPFVRIVDTAVRRFRAE